MISNKSSVPYYNHNAIPYFNRTFNHLNLHSLRTFISYLPAHATILDAGSGSGRDTRYFKDQGLSAIGLDASQELVTLSKKFNGPIEIEVADILLYSFPKEKFDGIWANRLLIHFQPDECRRVLAQFFYTLKPSGKLFLTFESGHEIIEDRKDDLSGPSRMIFRYSSDELASLLKQNGFQILKHGCDLNFPSKQGIAL